MYKYSLVCVITPEKFNKTIVADSFIEAAKEAKHIWGDHNIKSIEYLGLNPDRNKKS